MERNYIQRLRLRFRKYGAARYIGHLDLARTLERAFNRAKLPVAYTQGFNRRPRMQFATALPLGYTSEMEIVDLLLREEMALDEALAKITATQTPGIDVYAITEASLTEPSLQAQTIDTQFQITIKAPITKEELKKRVGDFLAADSIMLKKKAKKRRGRKQPPKSYDLRPLVIDLELLDRDDEQFQLFTSLHLKPSMTGRPDAVLTTLKLDPLSAHIHRLHITLASDLA